MKTVDLAPTENGEDEPLSGEMLSLAMQADGLDGEAHATSAEGVMATQAEEQALDQTSANQREVRMILALGVPVLGAMFPSIIALWTDQQCELVAASLGPVLTKYNISLGGMSERPEIAALMICGPLAFATYKGIQADIAARVKQVPKAGAGNAMPAPPAPPQHEVIG